MSNLSEKESLETMNVNAGPEILTIEPEVAQEYVDNWQKGECQIVPSTVTPTNGQIQLNSFSFSIDDFKFLIDRVNVYNENNPDNPIGNVVCRLGLKTSPGEKTVPCMFFEPLLGGISGTMLPNMLPLNNAGTESACYDVSYPCPPTCPR